MAKSNIDPFGEDDRGEAKIVAKAPATEITVLQAKVVSLQDQLEEARTEIALERERADAAEQKLKNADTSVFDPSFPHVAKADWSCVLRGGAGTMFLRAGQVITDPYVIAMVHELGAPIVRQ